MHASGHDDKEEDDSVRYFGEWSCSSRSTRSSSSSGDNDASGNNVRPAPVKYTHLKAITGLDELTLDSLGSVYN